MSFQNILSPSVFSYVCFSTVVLYSCNYYVQNLFTDLFWFSKNKNCLSDLLIYISNTFELILSSKMRFNNLSDNNNSTNPHCIIFLCGLPVSFCKIQYPYIYFLLCLSWLRPKLNSPNTINTQVNLVLISLEQMGPARP